MLGSKGALWNILNEMLINTMSAIVLISQSLFFFFCSINSRSTNVQYQWTKDSEEIPLEDGYTHFRIELDSKFHSVNRTLNSCRKGRNSYFALNAVNCKSTNPVVLVRLYNSIVLPAMLYCCEM